MLFVCFSPLGPAWPARDMKRLKMCCLCVISADFTPLDPARDIKRPKTGRQVPPYNGFGSEEDSLGNCLHMIPKPPQRDFVKFMAHDRRGHDSQVMRFTARLVTDVDVDKDRRFIVSFFRTDDTIQIHEPPVRNSG